jgi:hypothetical protein
LATFKGTSRKKYNKIINFSNDIYFTQNPRGWMNSELLILYMKQILIPFTKKYQMTNFHFILDSAPCHLKEIEKVKDLLKEEIFIIPKGATYLLQPIDLSLGKPLKDYMRKMFNLWFEDNHEKVSESGNIKNPTHKELLEMITKAQKQLSSEIIQSSFKLGKI